MEAQQLNQKGQKMSTEYKAQKKEYSHHTPLPERLNCLFLAPQAQQRQPQSLLWEAAPSCLRLSSREHHKPWRIRTYVETFPIELQRVYVVVEAPLWLSVMAGFVYRFLSFKGLGGCETLWWG